MANDQGVKVVELQLLDERPVTVTGDRGFVLFQAEVGRVEVGDPLPDNSIWDHFSGDLMLTAVHGPEGITTGGGDTWDSEQLHVLYSEPGSGSDPGEQGWVVVGRIPPKYDAVIIDHGGNRFQQAPIRRTVVFPLDSVGGSKFRVFGSDRTESDVLLFEPLFKP